MTGGGGFDLAIFGGKDHKTGQEADTESAYRGLERALRRMIPQAQVVHRWSGQVVETNDGLPLIGETASRQFAATGFAGNGMTFGTLGAMMAVDAFLKRKNPLERAVRQQSQGELATYPPLKQDLSCEEWQSSGAVLRERSLRITWPKRG